MSYNEYDVKTLGLHYVILLPAILVSRLYKYIVFVCLLICKTFIYRKIPHIIIRGIFMCISDFSNCELVALASTLAISISNQFSSEDVAVLSAFFSALGDNLAILSLE